MADSFYKDPAVTHFFNCPNCKRLLRFELDQCPDCRELIDEDQKLFSTVINVSLSQACSLANTISTGNPGIFLVLVATLLAYAADVIWMAPFMILPGVMMVAAIARWFRRYGWLPLDEPDLLVARREMRQSLMLWLAFLFLEGLVAYLAWW
ncbi:MAG TPA: hypothetical protein VFV34_13965 [Blastocatellia bacterium]|nr:hypothetical protein [Blastocatellia bacterium]